MKALLIFFMALCPLFLLSQSKDIELVEERGAAEIKLFAVNNTDEALDMTLTMNVVGFTSSETANPIKKVLEPKAKVYLTLLTAQPNVSCEYSTSISYKKVRKVNPMASKDGQKRRTTSVQMNTTKLNVFTQDGCGRCEFVINYLEKNQIPYVELNTSVHDPNQDLMFQKLAEAGFKGNTVQMPVIVTKEKTDYDIKDLQKYVKSLK